MSTQKPFSSERRVSTTSGNPEYLNTEKGDNTSVDMFESLKCQSKLRF